MAEDKSDNILEEEGAKEGKKDEDAQPQQGGLSTSLLIKVAIGLGVVLIAMLVAFFLLSSSPETDTAEVEAEVSEAASQELNEETSDTATDVTQESGTIELPPLTETATPSESTPTPATESTSAEETAVSQASTAKTPSDKVLSEMVALQKQLNTMQQENQKLIKRVEELTKESETLRQQLPRSTSSSASPINDEQAVNNNEVPLYYRENRYSNTPQPELKPQWGEFQQAR